MVGSLLSRAEDLFIQNLDVVYQPRNACFHTGGYVMNQKENIGECIKYIERAFFLCDFFLSFSLILVCVTSASSSISVDHELHDGAVKVNSTKGCCVSFFQAHRSPLAADLEHDTAISWCHT